MINSKGFKIVLFSIICTAAILGTIASFSYMFNGPYLNTNYLKSVDGLINSKEQFKCSYEELTEDEYDEIPQQQRDKDYMDYKRASNVLEKNDSIRKFLSNLKWEKSDGFSEYSGACMEVRSYNITISNSKYTFWATNQLEQCRIRYVDSPYELNAYYKFSRADCYELGNLILNMYQW